MLIKQCLGPFSQCDVIFQDFMIHESKARFEDTEKLWLSSDALVLILDSYACNLSNLVIHLTLGKI